MRVLRNILNIPLRVTKVVIFAIIVILVGVTGPFFWFFIDPLRWVLTGKLMGFYGRGDKIIDFANKIIDKINFNTENE